MFEQYNQQRAIMAILEEINGCVQETGSCDGDVVVLTNIIAIKPYQDMLGNKASDGSLLVQTTKLSHNVFQLEKNFQYHLYLLRTKDAEIIRLKTEIDYYVQQLKSKEYENSTMMSKFTDLNAQLIAANTEKDRVRLQCKDTISRLLKNMEEVKTRQECLEREHRLQEKKRETEWEEKLKACEEHKKKELSEINDWLEKERVVAKNLQTQIQNIGKENIALRMEFQQKHSSQISKISILESELKNKEQDKEDLLIQLNACQKDCAYYQNELQKAIAEKEKANQKLFASLTNITNSDSKLKEIMVEKESLWHQLKASKEEIESYIKKQEEIMQSKHELEKELEMCRSQPKYVCMDPKHNNIDVLIQQNTVLQNVVKAMRLERAENEEMEKKVERLENLVHILKTSMITNKHISENHFVMGDNSFVNE